jgi:hypothetical protein
MVFWRKLGVNNSSRCIGSRGQDPVGTVIRDFLQYHSYDFPWLPTAAGNGHSYTWGVIVFIGLDRSKPVKLRAGQLAGRVFTARNQEYSIQI